jgi:tRNA threonylcarbamoyladenosine biosynthesis protein TsaB
MLILALDTTSADGGVGIFRDAETLALVPNQSSASEYAVGLFELLNQALAAAGVELKDIDLYAAANGPGSFTGIRVGLAAALAWGRAFERPVRGVSVLEAMVHQSGAATDWAFSMLDARRGEFYLASFRRSSSKSPGDGGPEFEAADNGWLLKPEALDGFLAERLDGGKSATCLARGMEESFSSLPARLPASIRWQKLDGILAGSIAAIARKKVQSGAVASDNKLDAYYIRRPDAEVNWKA